MCLSLCIFLFSLTNSLFFLCMNLEQRDLELKLPDLEIWVLDFWYLSTERLCPHQPSNAECGYYVMSNLLINVTLLRNS
ncbi:hypothetical protein CsatB_009340 [Cannabis sativa]